MTPFYHCQISQFPIEAGDQRQSRIPSFSLGTSSASTSSCPPFLFDGKEDHGAFAGALPRLQGQLHEETQGSEWRNRATNKSSSYQPVPGGDRQREPAKWMSSKMRIMKKMIKSYQAPTLNPKRSKDQHLDQKKENLESIIRVCSDCSTTKTPLWRTGPCGPKSLCNACGIRQRKARRAMASSSSSPPSFSSVSKDRDRTVPFKKRCRFTATAASEESAQRKLCYEDIVISLNKSTALHRVFPQDEKDAAILLMALSCGLI